MFASVHRDCYAMSFGEEDLLMAPYLLAPTPRPGRRCVRVRSSTVCKDTSAKAVVSKSEWENLPRDVLLSVVAQLNESHVVPAVTACKEWLRQLDAFVYKAKLSQLPLATPAIDAARRTGLHLFLSREGMKASIAKICTTSSSRTTLISLYKHGDVRAILDMLAADTLCAFFRGLNRLGHTYIGLTELDLSNGVAVMSCEDYENLWRDGFQVHPQGHAALTQQAFPIRATELFKHLFPIGKPLLPGLTLLHLKLVKVASDSMQLIMRSIQGWTYYQEYKIPDTVKLCISFFYPDDLWTGAPLLPVDGMDISQVCLRGSTRLAHLKFRQNEGGVSCALFLHHAQEMVGVELDDSKNTLKPYDFEKVLGVTAMQQLTLTHSVLPDADLAKLWSLGHLTSLNLAGAANLSHVAVRSIASLPKLRTLDLSCCPLLSHSMLVDLSRLTSLEQMRLQSCSLSAERLWYLEGLPRLTHLEAAKCHSPLIQISQLCTLHMGHCQLTAACVEALTTMTALQSLNLDSAWGLSNDHVFALSALVNLTSLSMQSCGTRRSPIGCFTLAALQHMTNLAALNLNDGHFTPLALLPLGYLTRLRRLELAQCGRLCTADVLVVSSLHQLRHLNLASCRVLTDASLERVLPSTLQQLTALILCRITALTDAAVPVLCGLTSLQSLDVSDCTGISEAAVDEVYTASLRLRDVASNGVDKDVIPIRALRGCRVATADVVGFVHR